MRIREMVIGVVLLVVLILPNLVWAEPKVNDILKSLEDIMELKCDGTAMVSST